MKTEMKELTITASMNGLLASLFEHQFAISRAKLNLKNNVHGRELFGEFLFMIGLHHMPPGGARDITSINVDEVAPLFKKLQSRKETIARLEMKIERRAPGGRKKIVAFPKR